MIHLLGADYVQFPEISQSYNRYSYVMNNPLSRVDPSGEQEESTNGDQPEGQEVNCKQNGTCVENNESSEIGGEADADGKNGCVGNDCSTSRENQSKNSAEEISKKASEASGAIVIFTYDDYGVEISDHAAIWVGENGTGSLLDPSGSYVPDGIDKAEGAQRDIWDNVQLKDYIEYQLSIGSEDASVSAVQLNLNAGESAKMQQNMEDRMLNGESVWGGPVCSTVCSGFLKETIKSAPEGTAIPGLLHDQLIEKGHREW